MRFLILAAAALSATSSTVAQPPAQPAPVRQQPQSQFAEPMNRMPLQRDGAGRVCYDPNVHHAGLGGASKAERLGDLPPGSLILSVVRKVDGCQELVIASQGLGSTLQNERMRAPALNR